MIINDLQLHVANMTTLKTKHLLKIILYIVAAIYFYLHISLSASGINSLSTDESFTLLSLVRSNVHAFICLTKSIFD